LPNTERAGRRAGTLGEHRDGLTEGQRGLGEPDGVPVRLAPVHRERPGDGQDDRQPSALEQFALRHDVERPGKGDREEYGIGVVQVVRDDDDGAGDGNVLQPVDP
jgi:hypothetical protein